MVLNRVVIPSPNYSSRSNSSVRLIVLHTSEGATTFQSLGNYFANPSSQVSSHVGIDDTPGTIGEYVRRDYKAWTASGANPYAVQAELCTPNGAAAHWSAANWNQHPFMLQNAAQWLSEEAQKFDIPLIRLTPAQAQGNGRGVCQHSDLGTWGGSHYDCGPGFPIDSVISTANQLLNPTGGAVAICTTPTGRGYWICGSDGGVFTFGDATFLGSLGDTPLAAPIVGMAANADGSGYWMAGSDGGVFTFGRAIYYGSLGGKVLAAPINAIAATPSGQGYWLLGKDGGVFTFGDAGFYGAPTGLVK